MIRFILILTGKESKNKSGIELENNYLKPLGISRSKCWITNLVKVFLLKKGHYNSLNEDEEIERDNYDIYAVKSLPWINKEIEMANPKIIITLGREVAGAIRGVKGTKRNELLDYKVHDININGKLFKIIHMAHPGILMRKNKKWVDIHVNGLNLLKPEIIKLLNTK